GADRARRLGVELDLGHEEAAREAEPAEAAGAAVGGPGDPAPGRGDERPADEPEPAPSLPLLGRDVRQQGLGPVEAGEALGAGLPGARVEGAGGGAGAGGAHQGEAE